MTVARAYPGVEIRVSTPPTVGEAVLAVQQQLAGMGFACADIRGAKLQRNGSDRPIADIAGLYGPRTASAVTEFQKARGLNQDGIVGKYTWGALFGNAEAAAAEPAARSAPVQTAVNPDAYDTDLMKLHPEMRERVQRLKEALRANGVPMRVFEAFRAPERQRKLFSKGRDAKGRIVSKARVVTYARPFTSYHQYGLAVDMVIDRKGVNPWEDKTAEAGGWWKTYHRLAKEQGLEPLKFEMPHVQLAGLSIDRLLKGEYPDGGDDSWADNLAAAVERWTDRPKPPAPERAERPELESIRAPTDDAETTLDWRSLPAVQVSDWDHPFHGRPWRVDGGGIYLKEYEDGEQPLRSDGTPTTCDAIIDTFGPALVQASAKHSVPPEILVMIIATETGSFRSQGFTGPRTFRWEAHISDYSAGPVQMLSSTARDVSKKAGLGYRDEDFPTFAQKPNPIPDKLLLYDGVAAIDLCAAYIALRTKTTGMNPILISAAYNAGSVRESRDNRWGLRCHGDHLDRAARWFGDACDLIGDLRR